jgi:predicted phage tail component-like protein
MLTYKGISLEGKLKVLSVTRSLLPSSQLKTLELDGKAGGIFISKKHGMKKIEVEVAVIGATPENLREKVRELADLLDSEQPEALVFDDEPHLTDFAILEGETDMEEQLKLGTGAITFLCPNPYSVGAERSHSFETTTFDWKVYDLVYNGTAPVYPKVTVTFNGATTYFEMWLGENFVKVEFNFQAGTVLEMDFNTGKVLINGTLNLQALTLQSDFFPLKKGTNTISTSEFAGVVVSYNERFK